MGKAQAVSSCFLISNFQVADHLNLIVENLKFKETVGYLAICREQLNLRKVASRIPEIYGSSKNLPLQFNNCHN